MATEFSALRKMYDDDQIIELLKQPDGIYWLKLRSISRSIQLKDFCNYIGLNCEDIPSRQLLQFVYEKHPDLNLIDAFIRDLYHLERIERLKNEDYLISQLYQMKVFDWGGLYQNSLEQTIVDNYVKRIQNWDQLNSAIENELHLSMRGYVQCSWYNHWSSIIIEDIFKDHTSVLPSMGLVKRVDFFIHDFPFDLKVTYFPEGYMRILRREAGLRPELTELKAYCRREEIWFDNNKPNAILSTELFTRLSEHPSESSREFIKQFKDTRLKLIHNTIRNPEPLKIWLYENQGIRRFDAANRFFLILINADDIEESWKLKRNKDLLIHKIHNHLDSMTPEGLQKLRITFNWQNNVFETFAETLFIIN